MPPPTSTPTELAPAGLGSAPPSASSSRPSRPPSNLSGTPKVRFPPGTIVGDRFRIESLLGRGGMGEVYRADDLTLDQPVALKFLPEEMAADVERLERFLGEVRVARQVAHPNVCRVYDIGVLDGHHFISMELVEGDDLVTLLRQVGRFPEEKALEIARQICAGLAAAHDRGIIHRDLKPANIMIDRQGKVRITDFGLASMIGTVEGAEVFAGTPTYMAPEQLAGREVSVRSDIFALGLLLFELFTGKPAHKAATMAELNRLHESAPTSPASHVPDMDPAVERLILSCLARDPNDRPGSALAVAAALPGGDPLAAALAAGETPSPELVAAAGSEGTLRPRTAVLLAMTGLVSLGIAAWLGLSNSAASMVSFERPPAYLAEVGKEILGSVMPDDAPIQAEDWAVGGDWAYLRHAEKDESVDRWADLESGRHSNVLVWYRRSPRELKASPGFTVVSPSDPPLSASGEGIVWVDSLARLTRLEVVPDQFVETPSPPSTPDWTPLFDAALLDLDAFEPTEPQWTPPMNTDVRAAWEGPHPTVEEMTLRVEAGAFQGRVVFFRVIGPWTRPERMELVEESLAERVAQVGGLLIAVGVLVFAIGLAKRNLDQGRGDRRGAFVVAFWYLVVHSIVWLMWADHVSDLGDEWSVFQMDIGYNLFLAVMIWIFYMALEPSVRRRWPDTLISWSRLLSGHVRDPLVGRDVLIGLAGGGLVVMFLDLGRNIARWMGKPPETPNYPNWPEGGVPEIVGILLDMPVHGLLSVMQVLLFVVLAGIVVRKRWIAATIGMAVFTTLAVAQNVNYPAIEIPLGVIGISIFFYVLCWHGLLAGTVAIVVANGFSAFPLSTDLGAWHQGSTLAGAATLLGITVFAFRTATAGRPLLRDGLLD